MPTIFMSKRFLQNKLLCIDFLYKNHNLTFQFQNHLNNCQSQQDWNFSRSKNLSEEKNSSSHTHEETKWDLCMYKHKSCKCLLPSTDHLDFNLSYFYPLHLFSLSLSYFYFSLLLVYTSIYFSLPLFIPLSTYFPPTVVNFINVFCTRFLYKRRFSSLVLVTFWQKSTFVRKKCAKNVDEIDTFSLPLPLFETYVALYFLKFTFLEYHTNK